MSEMVLVEEEEKPLTLKEVLCPPEGKTRKPGPWIESQEAHWRWEFQAGRWVRQWRVGLDSLDR